MSPMALSRRRRTPRTAANRSAMRWGPGFLAIAALQACAPSQVASEPRSPPAACSYYDAHAHLISSDIGRYPRNPMVPPPLTAQSPLGPGRVGIPGGMHGPHPVNLKPTAEQMLEWMAQEGVCAIAAVQKGMIYRTDNRYIVDAATLYPDHMVAVAIVDPQAAETPRIMRALASRGVVGVRFFGTGIDDELAWMTCGRAQAIWALADELGLVVDIEAPMTDGTRLIPAIAAMADLHPDMPIVLDHVLMPETEAPQYGLDEAYLPLAERKNVFVKFTSLNMDVIREHGFAPAAVLRRVVDLFGADRVMWGSDIGTSSGTYAEMVQRAVEATALLDESERRAVLRDTGWRVFERALSKQTPLMEF